ncbi:MAG: acyltransferase family protein [Dokdonella sp.]
MSLIKYRPDIDGLRALAVLAVVLFHFGIGPFGGGFVGVDVFFVISGYLITCIIQKEIDGANFTFAGFYERRMRRLFPALFAMMLVVLAAGTVFLLPSDLLKLGNSTLATLVFVSNVWFMRQSGYFDASSALNPLLHTWSLAVEEQFYIGLPVLLLLIAKFSRRYLKWILLASALLSLLACLVVQPLQAKLTFFLPPFRAWELLIGAWMAVGGCAVIRLAPAREILAALALLVLIGSFIWIPNGISFPGWIAMFPVLATASLLHLGRESGTRIHRLLSWKPLAGIGVISYSWYLWHFPIIVLANYHNAMQPLPAMPRVGLLVLSLIVSVASYRWIETPFRRRKNTRAPNVTRSAVLVGVAVSSLVAFAAVGVKQDRGWRSRVSNEVASMDGARMPIIPFKACDDKGPQPANVSCVVGQLDSPHIALIWGDSHALAWAPGLDAYLAQESIKGVLAVNSGCAPLLGLRNPKDPSCLQHNEAVIAWLQQHPVDRLYLIAAWASWSMPDEGYDLIDLDRERGNDRLFVPALQRTIHRVQLLAKKIILIGPTPGAPDQLPLRLALQLWKGTPAPRPVAVVVVNARNNWFWHGASSLEKVDNLQTVDPTDWFCDNIECKYSFEDAKLLYRDGHHLSVAGALFAADHLGAEIATSRPAKNGKN